MRFFTATFGGFRTALPVAGILVAIPAIMLPVAPLSAQGAGDADLTGVWYRQPQLLAPAPKPNQRTSIESAIAVQNVGGRVAVPSRIRFYLVSNRPNVNPLDPFVSRFLDEQVVPALVPGERWNGSLNYQMSPGSDPAGLRVVAVLNATGTVRETNRQNNLGTSQVIPLWAQDSRTATGVSLGTITVEGVVVNGPVNQPRE
jgi:hypothetical protein